MQINNTMFVNMNTYVSSYECKIIEVKKKIY